ncbi:MAG TPA: YkgJ family cysteine cluster protein [Kofleriaceae bacterium]|nr:YkgJ family cysteine cluster protein [Kofleriaceae bacterium]
MRLTVDFGSPSASAAPVKLLVSTTFVKTTMSLRSMANPGCPGHTLKPMSRYPELAAKVDGFFARAMERHGDDMRCDTGCSHCCHVRLSVTRVEAEAIRDELSSWPAERRAVLARNIAAALPDRCVALDADGRCLVYASRPIVCRSHGAPIRLTQKSLPIVTSCRENFTARGPAAADADCILDQATLSALTLAVDRDAGGDGSRTDLDSWLATVLADC